MRAQAARQRGQQGAGFSGFAGGLGFGYNRLSQAARRQAAKPAQPDINQVIRPERQHRGQQAGQVPKYGAD